MIGRKVNITNWNPKSKQLAAVGLCILVLTAVIAAGLAVHADHRSDARIHAQQEGRAFAMEVVPKLLSYDFDTVAEHFADMQNNLGGDFRRQFEEVGRTVIVPSARERQVVTTAEVIESSVVDADADNTELLLFVNQSTTSSESPETKLDGSRVRVHVERSDGRWLITSLTPV